MLPMSVAQSSSGMFTIGRIAYIREEIFFRIDALAAKGITNNVMQHRG